MSADPMADYVARLVAEAPPLTPEQCVRLAVLLQPAARLDDDCPDRAETRPAA